MSFVAKGLVLNFLIIYGKIELQIRFWDFHQVIMNL